MKIMPPQARWISPEDGNPTYGKVIGLEHNPKDGYVLNIQLETGEERRASLWGKNLVAAMRAMGNDSDAWLGRKFSCAYEEAVGGKTIRTFSFS